VTTTISSPVMNLPAPTVTNDLIIDRIRHYVKNLLFKQYFGQIGSHGMTWDGMGWDGTPFKNVSSHPMGWLKKFLSHGTIFFVPSHPTRSPGTNGFLQYPVTFPALSGAIRSFPET